jgi:hypothetical protein
MGSDNLRVTARREAGNAYRLFMFAAGRCVPLPGDQLFVRSQRIVMVTWGNSADSANSNAPSQPRTV